MHIPRKFKTVSSTIKSHEATQSRNSLIVLRVAIFRQASCLLVVKYQTHPRAYGSRILGLRSLREFRWQLMPLAHISLTYAKNSELSLKVADRQDLMISLHVEVPYASFRKSFARSFAETYPLPPPSP